MRISDINIFFFSGFARRYFGFVGKDFLATDRPKLHKSQRALFGDGHRKCAVADRRHHGRHSRSTRPRAHRVQTRGS